MPAARNGLLPVLCPTKRSSRSAFSIAAAAKHVERLHSSSASCDPPRVRTSSRFVAVDWLCLFWFVAVRTIILNHLNSAALQHANLKDIITFISTESESLSTQRINQDKEGSFILCYICWNRQLESQSGVKTSQAKDPIHTRHVVTTVPCVHLPNTLRYRCSSLRRTNISQWSAPMNPISADGKRS